MKLKEKNIFAMCNKLKDVLIAGGFVLPTEKIYIQTNPNTDIPNDYIVISGNGGFTDLGDVSTNVILIEISVKLLSDKSINNVRMNYITSSLSDILDKSVVKDNYYFSISKNYNIFDNVDITMGYAVKILNIEATTNRTL